MLWTKGWAEKNAGNLSVRVETSPIPVGALPKDCFIKREIPHPELAGDCFLVTGTGVRFRDVAEDPETTMALLRVSEDLKGFHVLWGGRGGADAAPPTWGKQPIFVFDEEGNDEDPSAKRWAPTSELPSHLAMHALLKKTGRSARTVLHTHPAELLALSHLKDLPKGKGFTELLWSMIPEVKMYLPGGIALAPYSMPGSAALAKATLQALQGGAECVVWEMHGMVAVGQGPLEAFDVADTANKAAQVYLLARATGQKPRGLSKAQLKEIEKRFPPPKLRSLK
jgi:rhamnulose-1-phosphate aldolase